MERVDIAIIGTGPAGISAAVTAKARNKKILLFGSSALSDKVSKACKILNYPGLPDVSGESLSERFKGHLKNMDITITEKKVNAVYPMGDFFGISTAEDMFEAKSVILATGVVEGKAFAGEKEFLGRGVSYCATCDAQLYRGKTVAVMGYDEVSGAEASYLAGVVEKVYYYPMSSDEPEVAEAVEVIRELPREIVGDTKVEQLKTDENTYAVDGVFILRDEVLVEQLVQGIEMEGSHVKVNLMMETNIPGIFACGDIAGKPYQYIKAAGQGNVAALSATSYLEDMKV